jgi:hypothetical protein
MHAIIGIFSMDRARHAEQQVELHERIIPMVRQLPGFVSGTWSYDPETFRHYSHIVLESAEGARELAAMVEENLRTDGERAGVAVESLTVVEVLGEARAGS